MATNGEVQEAGVSESSEQLNVEPEAPLIATLIEVVETVSTGAPVSVGGSGVVAMAAGADKPAAKATAANVRVKRREMRFI